MTSIALPTQNYSASFCERCKQKILPHTDLIESLSYMAMNIYILAGKVFKAFPAALSNTAKGLLSYLSVISINLSIEQLIKSAGDVSRAWKCQDKRAVLLTVIKVAVIAINILLTAASLVAAGMLICGFPAGLLLYMLMRPFALVTLVTDIVLQGLGYAENHRVLKELETIDEKKQREVVEQVSKILNSSSESSKFETTIIRQMSPYSLKQFKKEIKGKSTFQDDDIKKLYAKIKKNIELNATMYKAELGLRALGYTAMFFCRLYPESILEKSILLGMNMIYTGKILYRKHREN